MAKACPTCKGRGRWLEAEQQADEGETEVMAWRDCNDCHGTGVKQDAEDGDDFDIGGSSYAEGD